MATSMSWTLKVEFEGDVRRLRNWPEQGCEPSFSSLRSAIGVLLGFSSFDAEPLSIKYRDDEGDLCTLNEATLPDALALAAEPPRLLRLVLARLPSGDDSAGTAATPTRGVAELEATPLPALPPSTPASTCAAEPPAAAAAVAAASGSANEGETAAAANEGETAAAAASGAAGEAEAAAEATRPAGRAEVRRQLGEGLAHFGRQVASDFCSARKDAKDAFRPKGNLAGREERACLVDKVSVVPATVIGAVVAARLAPVRLTKLAAHSVATVAGKSTSMEDWETPVMANASSTEEPPAGETQDSTAGGSGDLKEEFKHFTQQVTQDFQVAKADVQAAFGYVLGGPRPSAEHHPSAQEQPSPPQPMQDQLEQPAPRQEEQEPQQERPPQPEAQQRWTARSAVPALASTVAGVTVASTLVPVRALRLAVASAAAVASARAVGRQETTGPVRTEEGCASARGAAGAVRTEEGPAEPLQADQEADEVVAGASAQLAEDEALARRLQAEEDADAAAAAAHGEVQATPAATSQP